MNVLHINAGNEYGGGMYHVVALVKQLCQRGVESQLVVFEDGPVAQHAREQGVPVQVLPQRFRYDWQLKKDLGDFLATEKIDIVHAHGPRAVVYAAAVKKDLPNIHYIATVHSDPLVDFKGKGLLGLFFKQLYLRRIKQMDHVITVSASIQQVLEQQGIPLNQLSVIRSGIAYPSDYPRADKKQDTLHFVAVGRLEPVKQYDLLLEAFHQMQAGRWRLTIVGDGSERDNLVQKVHVLGLSQQVHFTGWVSQEAVGDYLDQADVFVLSSRSEGFPLVVLEAVRAGLPVIGTDVGDVCVFYTDETAPFLLPEMIPYQYARVLDVMYSEWAQGQLDALSRLFFWQGAQFSVDRQLDKTIQLYKMMQEDKS
ncbi:glycosyltransferase [Dolosigranulum savutiense]|uniref:Glycosyltransferase n=1 Tax=Dolosigranulum savutiense TaxID=3110288 RepID=A0AB74TS21_9LACT